MAACACVTKLYRQWHLLVVVLPALFLIRSEDVYQRLKKSGMIYLSMKAAGKTKLQDAERCIVVKELVNDYNG